MESMDWVQWLSGVTMGLALAATCGLRAFLPLFAVSCLGATGQIELADHFQWLERPVAVAGLGIAVLLEIAGDKFPIVDHLLDTAGVIIKPIAATMVSASVMTEMDPMIAAVLGLVVGGSMAEGVHLVKAKVRLWSSALTAAIANPFLSLLEDCVAAIAIVLAILFPVVVIAFAVVGGAIGYRWWIRGRKQPA